MVEYLYESADVIAVNKPSGLVTIPERQPGPTLVDAVRTKLGETVYVVHRLDREVSGVVLFARNPATHRLLNGLFERRQIVKHYRAIVLGKVAVPEGIIDAPIRMFGSGRMGVDVFSGKPSTTRYRVVASDCDFTLLDVFPQTGRRHQIRVHLYHTEHPIAGDLKYGNREKQSSFARLYLHAFRIEWTLPSGERFAVEAPEPSDFTLPPA